jgi:hypothetical protein
MYYLIIAMPATIVLTIAGYRLFMMRRDDKVLLRFWSIRRDAMAYLLEKDSIDREEYKKVKAILRFTNDKIKNFDRYKSSLFNIRELDFDKDKFKDALETVDEERDDSEVVKELKGRVVVAMASAFFAYTPFSILVPTTLLLLVLAAMGVHFARETGRFMYRIAKDAFGNSADRYRHPPLATGT